MILSGGKHQYHLIDRIGVLVNPEVVTDFQKIIPPALSDNEKESIRNYFKNIPSDEYIEGQLCNTSNLVLCVTDRCNFRCKYCTYSGNYGGEREHGVSNITLDTAQRGLELFFHYLGSPNRTIKHNKVSIGFYGGEALLELRLIKKIVAWAKDKIIQNRLQEKFTFQFSISSNGYLLTDEVVDYLVRENIYIAISIDGPKEEHDKFRVNVNGEGTWDVIYENILNMINRYPDFYKQYVSFLSTAHPLHDGEAIDSFFLSNQNLFDIPKVRFNKVNTFGLKESELKMIEENKSNKRRSRFGYFQDVEKKFDEKNFRVNILKNPTTFTGTCFPGSIKTMVDVDGSLHICEKMSPHFPIGNVWSGFDFKRIKELVEIYNNAIIDMECWNCRVWFLCHTCYAHYFIGEKQKFFCPAGQIVKNLEKYLAFKEKENENHKKNIDINTISDYLEFLH